MRQRNPDMMAVAAALIDGYANRMQHQFLMSWTGSKVPRGAKIDGTWVEWTQHGVVTGSNRQLGFYERLEEFGGPNRDQHTIVIFTDHTEVIQPDEKPATEITIPATQTS